MATKTQDLAGKQGKKSTLSSADRIKSGGQAKQANKKSRTARPPQPEPQFGDSLADEILLILIILVSIIVAVSVYTKKMGTAGGFLNTFFKGLFGFGAYVLPLLVILVCIWILVSENRKTLVLKLFAGLIFLLSASVLFHTISAKDTGARDFLSLYQQGDVLNGGVVGGLLGNLLIGAFSKIGAYIFVFFAVLISVIMGTGKSLFLGISALFDLINDGGGYRDEKPRPRADRSRETEPRQRVRQEKAVEKKKKKKGSFDIRISKEEGRQDGTESSPVVEAMVFEKKPEKTKKPKETAFAFAEEPPAVSAKKGTPVETVVSLAEEKGKKGWPASSAGKYTKPSYEAAAPSPFDEDLANDPDIAYDLQEKRITILDGSQEAAVFMRTADGFFEEKRIEAPKAQEPQPLTEKLEAAMPIAAEAEAEPPEILIVEQDAFAPVPEPEAEWNLPSSVGMELFVQESVGMEISAQETELLPLPQEAFLTGGNPAAKMTADRKTAQEATAGKAKNLAVQEMALENAEELAAEKAEIPEELAVEEEETKHPPEQRHMETKAAPEQDKTKQKAVSELENAIEKPEQKPVLEEAPYVFPPIDLLGINRETGAQGSKMEMLANAKKLEDTLKSFGVDAKVIQINRGPTVTRYELSPSQGVKVSKIVNLSDDIALNLAASGIRIEAPIPGKAAVGIEVPNKEAQSVFLREVIDTDTFRNFPSKLAFALGQDIAGNAIVTDIAKMPHLLIAGATGSGKSVCINTMITSILYKADPKEVKLLLVDPKVVELSVYNGIPHLLIPVVTDPKKAAGALNWAVREMLSRYQSFAEHNVRDIKGFNAMKKEKGEIDLMPQIVIVIDELADLMMAAPGDVEDAICRLAQMARAAGLHLIIATQRPSVDVITGVIKANIPSRLAFAVSSGIDSRTILDMTGAEKLLGKGDMLFYPTGMSKPVRIQGAFVTDKEVENIVSFVKKDRQGQYDESMIAEITQTGKNMDAGGDSDELLEQAVELVVMKQKASASMLQRQFRIGYNRAARLMEDLERRGIVGQEEGSKPRRVLMTKEEFAEGYAED